MKYNIKTECIGSPGWTVGPMKVVGAYCALMPGGVRGQVLHAYTFDGLFEVDHGAASLEFDEPQRIECKAGQVVRFQLSAGGWPILLFELTPEDGKPVALTFKRGEALQFEISR